MTKKKNYVKIRESSKAQIESVDWLHKASVDGRMLSRYITGSDDKSIHKKINLMWNDWVKISSFRPVTLRNYTAVLKSFLNGCALSLDWDSKDRLLIPTIKDIAVVLAVKDEEKTLPAILKQLQRLPLNELIIVINGSTDNTYQIAQNAKLAKVVSYPLPLGHDVGRAIGAKMVDSELILFLDGDIVFEAEQLIPFIYSTELNNEVVLNDISPYLGPFKKWDSVTIMKGFLNRVLNRPDLKMNSLTAVPHLLTKKALVRIGYDNLAVPPVAHVLAIQNRLRIGVVSGIDVVNRNKIREINNGTINLVSELIIGDHLEALTKLMQDQGSRLSFLDRIRDRSVTKIGFVPLLNIQTNKKKGHSIYQLVQKLQKRRGI